MSDFSEGVRRGAWDSFVSCLALLLTLDVLPAPLCRLDDFADARGAPIAPSK